MSEWTNVSYRAAPSREDPRRCHSFEVRYRRNGDIDLRFRLADTTEIPIRLTKADVRDLFLALNKGRRR